MHTCKKCKEDFDVHELDEDSGYWENLCPNCFIPDPRSEHQKELDAIYDAAHNQGDRK